MFFKQKNIIIIINHIDDNNNKSKTLQFTSIPPKKEGNPGNDTQKKSTSPYSTTPNTATTQSLNDRGTENTNPNMLCTDNERLLMLQRFASNNYCSSDESEDSFGTENKQNQWSGQTQWCKKNATHCFLLWFFIHKIRFFQRAFCFFIQKINKTFSFVNDCIIFRFRFFVYGWIIWLHLLVQFIPECNILFQWCHIWIRNLTNNINSSTWNWTKSG